jgi:hypothetical protein
MTNNDSIGLELVIMKKKMEFSKKIVVITGLIFAIAVLVCIGIFVFCTINNFQYDWTGIVTLLGVTGAVFGTSIAAYENKACRENIPKIKIGFLQEKYKILDDIGALDYGRAMSEIENTISQIDGYVDVLEETNTTEITHQQMM